MSAHHGTGAEAPGLFALLAGRQVAAAGRAQGALRPLRPYAFDRIGRAGDNEPIGETHPAPATERSDMQVSHVEHPGSAHDEPMARVGERPTASSAVAKTAASAQEPIEHTPRPRVRDEQFRALPISASAAEPSRPVAAASKRAAPPSVADSYVRHLHTHQHIPSVEPTAPARVAAPSASAAATVRPLPSAPRPAPLVAARREPGFAVRAGDRPPAQETTIEIHIGRLEVRAGTDAQAPRETPGRPSRDDRLAAHLRRRAAGARS